MLGKELTNHFGVVGYPHLVRNYLVKPIVEIRSVLNWCFAGEVNVPGAHYVLWFKNAHFFSVVEDVDYCPQSLPAAFFVVETLI